MKKNVFYLFSLLSCSSIAQTDLHCGSDIAMKRLYDANPALKAERIRQDQASLNQLPNKTASVTATYVVPLVVHILHQDGPENISDAQVRDAVRVLNLDYAKQNADFGEVIPEFQGIADSTKIQFVLATRDPNGNCTTGIIHHKDSDTDWDEQSPTLYSYTWDPTMYMNVYVVRSITMSNGFQASGYAYYPGSWPDGYSYDAIVLLHNYFGTIGTGHPFLTRVLTHEAGHWLNLAHVFGTFQTAGIDCSDDDNVNDTPPTIGYLSCPNPAIPSMYQVCSPGVSENFQNFMDYSYCTRMFTQGQGQRMQNCLQSSIAGRNNLWSASNLLATGVTNPAGPCAPIADFKYSRTRTCVNTPVLFTDNSSGGTPTSFNWTFPGGSPAASTSSAPSVSYAAPGIYNVSHTVSNGTGNSAVTKTSIIEVIPNTAPYSGNWSEGFENQQTIASDWTMESLNGAANWERTSSAAVNSVYSVRINRLMNTRKNRSSMTGPLVNISQLINPALNFKVAVAESYPNHQNVLKVYISSDCGATWSTIYNKSTPSLITSASTVSNFIPTSISNWRTETISLTSYTATGTVSFKFEYLRDTLPQTNNIYIEDINISGALGIVGGDEVLNNITVFPIPSKGELNVSFELVSSRKIGFLVTDLLGKTVEISPPQEFDAGPSVQKLKLNQNLAPGIYFLKLQMEGNQVTRKILIVD